MDELYVERERKIFRYHDGADIVFGDPLALYRGLQLALAGDLDRVLSDWYRDSRLPEDASAEDRSEAFLFSAQAEAALLPAVRDVFEMAPFDRKSGAGATDADVQETLERFIDFLSQKKSRPESFPMSAPPTEAESSEADPTTEPS